ncbi:MAG TPA: efflux RND transporter periplasmic adaptor subunit, partial [Salinimicrobium sp.]|nr:efflux RND transporter periplasmic adaptor subunit [Salinimicrobium sp.]
MRKLINKRNLIIGVTLLIGLFIGWIIKPSNDKILDHQIIESSDNQLWTCSMHPQIRKHEPGDCPICGMDLIPIEDNMVADPHAVQMSEYAMKLANIQTLKVGAKQANKEISLNGKVAVDERKVYAQSTHIPGRIEQLMVNFTGEEVRRGQALARIFSTEMISAQQELLQAYALRESSPALFQAAKEKLRNWKISENQINRILENRNPIENFVISADVSGIVTEKLVEPGDYVERGMPIYTIADLSTVWVLFDIYEKDMMWIKEGSKVEFTVASLPGETFKGTVDFVDPLLNSQTRVSTARVVVNNSDGRLKPGMFVSGLIENPMAGGTSELTVPKSAVLWTGDRSVVYVKKDHAGQPEFLMKEVVLGASVGNS